MKKVLVVINNLDVGGIQKSLLNLLKDCSDKYDFSLLTFSQEESDKEKIPQNVKIIQPKKIYKSLGKSSGQLKSNKFLYLVRGFCSCVAKMFTVSIAYWLIGLFQPKIKGYDTVISFSHLTSPKTFYSGTAEFVLNKTKARNKVCFIHCDYLNSGTRCKRNDRLYARFDKIACCSESVKGRFLEALPELKDKAYTVRNFYDLDFRNSFKEEEAIVYGKDTVNLISVCRLGKEKGVDRVIRAIAESSRTDIRYFVVGSGDYYETLSNLAKEKGVADYVTFISEVQNPAIYMKNADWLVVASYHEAAPMVFDEAKMLNLPVLTTRTTSADEMITDGYGGVVENDDQSIFNWVLNVTKNRTAKQVEINNELQEGQIQNLFEGR
ncbi:MAG: glycosyltransferase [Clostridia bacterium]|nr:glycosyltransferase [Clostridia bacterium]